MIVDTIPAKFGQVVQVDIDAIYRKEGILCDLKLEDKQVIEFIGNFKAIVERVYESLTHTYLDDRIRLYIQNEEDFQRDFINDLKMEYPVPIDPKEVGAYQQGYRIFMKAGKNEPTSFNFLMHELGGTIFPYDLKFMPKNELGVSDLTINRLVASEFFHEVAHHYLQYASVIKYMVETYDNPKERKMSIGFDYTSLPFHYHAAKEAVRLLKLHQSPLDIYPEYYSGKIKTNKIIAMIPTESGEEVQWIGPEHPAYWKGEIFRVKSINDLCTLP